MRHDLLWVALIVTGAVLVFSLFHPAPQQTRTKVERVICYVQTQHPLSVVCPDQSYWHPLGPSTPIPPTPQR